MNSQVIITSTNSIEGMKIMEYLDLISTNVVLGTNFFSDFGASITDVLGGTSENYTRKLQEIYALAMKQLKEIAIYKGADAIIGISVDFDEISGKGKSMFMISATGTAVLLESLKLNNNISENNKHVSTLQLNKLVQRQKIKDEVLKGNYPTQQDWNYLSTNPIDEISEKLLEWYLKFMNSNNEYFNTKRLLVEKFPSYLQSINFDYAVDILYTKLKDYPALVIKLIHDGRFFSPLKVSELLKDGFINYSINCLVADAKNYSNDDLQIMKKIHSHYENLPDIGKIAPKKGLMSKERDVYICPNNHSNSVEKEFCNHSNCGKNIKGLTRSQIEKVKDFKLKIEVLESIINKN